MTKIYPKRDPWVYKGQMGKILVIGGDYKHTGSVIFNGMAALRSGADLVTIASPERVANIAASYTPDFITVPLKGNYLTHNHLPVLLSLANDCDSIVLGCGVGKEKETAELVIEIIRKIYLPMVVDADAIRILGERRKNLNLNGRDIIITPHSDEFLSLTNEKVLPDIEDRKEKTRKWAKILSATILLKGHVDVISDGKEIETNEASSVYMTKGGFGDTLAGICGTLLSRKIPTFDAAVAGAFINGKAGEMAAKKHGEGVIASDIFLEIPKAIKGL